MGCLQNLFTVSEFYVFPKHDTYLMEMHEQNFEVVIQFVFIKIDLPASCSTTVVLLQKCVVR
jgi:hypothetical protein